jgi:hypothetical protein
MALKKTSEIIAVSFDIEESATDTFTQEQVNLSLDPLNREVFVVLAVDLDVGTPSGIPGTTTQSRLSVTSTSQSGSVTLADSACLAKLQLKIVSGGVGDSVGFTDMHPDSPTASGLDYIGIIATDNFYVQIKGANNTGPIGGSGRMWGYRARADADIYAALVQSEVLSA